MLLKFYTIKKIYFYFIFILLGSSKQLNLFSSVIIPPVLSKNKNHWYQYKKVKLQGNNLLNNLSSEYKKTKQSKSIIKADTNNSNLWSNAFNFKKIWGTQINPRTGILSAHIKVGSLLSNLGHGPNIDLEVNYSSNTYADTDKLGQGWNWNLTHLNPITYQLTTSTGQNFYLQKNSNGQWFPLYHKLKDIHIDAKKDCFIITYTNGLKEILNSHGYETALEQQDGWQVHFLYYPGSNLLHFVVDNEGHNIVLKWEKGNIIVISRGSEGQSVPVVINTQQGKLRNILLPLQKSSASYGIHFSYTGNFITQITYPTGLKKIYDYNCYDAMKVNSDGKTNLAICVVVKETVNPAGQPVMITRYQYTSSNSNNHNYLGFNSRLESTSNTFKDSLFEAPVSYTYSTIEDNGIIRTLRTYNKYHLLIDEQQISDRTENKLSEVQSFFCRTDQINGCAYSSFANLPVTYSQPLKVITKLWGNSTGYPATTIETSQYDQQGRMIFHTDAFGRLTQVNYCPVRGDTACPPQPHNWFFSNLTESVTLYPAHTTTPESSRLLPVTTRNYYRKQFNRSGSDYILVLDHQVQQAGDQKKIITRRYYQDVANPLTYGLLKQLILTGNQQGHSKLNRIETNYYYAKSSDSYRKITYSAVKLETGKRRFSSFITTSLFTNHVLQSVDPSGTNTVHYHYDRWDRLIQTDFIRGTPFTVSTYYEYIVSPLLNQIIITAVNKLQNKIIFDGIGRQLMNYGETISVTGKAIQGKWILKEKTAYDKYGRTASRFAYITDSSGKINSLKVTEDYDDSGRIIYTHLPNGEKTVTTYDDADRCVMSYQQSNRGRRSIISLTQSNVLYQPVRQWVFPANDKPIPSLHTLCIMRDQQIILSGGRISKMSYDAFGRLETATDSLKHVVKKYYNVFGQLTYIADPVGDSVHYVYDLTGHIVQTWIRPVSGSNYLLSSAEYNAAGELLWQAGEDGKRTTFTYTEDGKPRSTTTPARHTTIVKYDKSGRPVANLLDGKLQLQINYDPVTQRIINQTDITGKTTFIYDDDGLPRKQYHLGKKGYPDYQFSWQYDANRRVVSVTDIAANQTQKVYDSLGRTAKMRYQPYQRKPELLSAPVYDDFSRTVAIKYGSGMYRKIHYDSMGHSDMITDKLNNQPLSYWSFNYDPLDNITMKLYKTKEDQAVYHYQYDALNNLANMSCNGTNKNILCPRDTAFQASELQSAPVIVRQNYHFTPLNRLASVEETLQNTLQSQTLSKLTAYQYTDNTAPLRLQKISTSWNHNPQITRHFYYDIVGNMTTDDQGNRIVYNAYNQITRVTQFDGQKSSYTYDGSGRETMEKSIQGISYLIYRGNHLVNEKVSSPGQAEHITGYQGIAKTIDGAVYQYNESNYKGDVVGILAKSEKNNNNYKLQQTYIYSPYGMIWHKRAPTVPLYQRSLSGFDGERTDPSTGWQFLGAGHRTYNPKQRYFVNEDPAGGGYAFGSNNPIMNSDPTGNIPQWIGTAFKWAGYVSSFGLSALHAKWANIVGEIINAGLTVATLGASVYSYGGALPGLAVTAGVAIAGSVPVAAAAIPANKGLNIAGAAIGVAQMAAMVATAAIDAGLFFTKKVPLSMAKMLMNRSDIALEDLNFQMFKTKTSAGKVSFVARINLKQFLEEKIPSHMNRNFLCIYSFSDLIRWWSVFRSENNDLIACDTACLLAVLQIKQYIIPISELQDFLDVKYMFMKAVAEVKLGSMNYMVKAVPDKYLNLFGRLLDLIPGEYYDYTSSPTISLDNIFGYYTMGIVFLPGHTQIVIRYYPDWWATYNFVGNGVTVVHGQLDDIESLLFSHIDSSSEKKILACYMIGLSLQFSNIVPG